MIQGSVQQRSSVHDAVGDSVAALRQYDHTYQGEAFCEVHGRLNYSIYLTFLDAKSVAFYIQKSDFLILRIGS
jgi:hypothetical protein